MIRIRCDQCGARGPAAATIPEVNELAAADGWDLNEDAAGLAVRARCVNCVDGVARDLAEPNPMWTQSDIRPDLSMTTAMCPRCGGDYETLVPDDGDGFEGFGANLCAECVVATIADELPADPETLAAGLLALVLVTLTGAPGRVQMPAKRRVSAFHLTMARAMALNLM